MGCKYVFHMMESIILTKFFGLMIFLREMIDNPNDLS